MSELNAEPDVIAALGGQLGQLSISFNLLQQAIAGLGNPAYAGNDAYGQAYLEVINSGVGGAAEALQLGGINIPAIGANLAQTGQAYKGVEGANAESARGLLG